MNLNKSHLSLRHRFLWLLVATCTLAAALVALGSWWLGTRQASQTLQGRYDDLRLTLRSASYPLTGPVLQSVARFSQVQIITLNPQNQVIESSFHDLKLQNFANRKVQAWSAAPTLTSINDQDYLASAFTRDQFRETVVILFNARQVGAAKIRASILPLLTGLSTIILLSTAFTIFSGATMRRIERLQKRVAQVATGDFETQLAVDRNDEIGQLSSAVNTMTGQLRDLWGTVNRQQGEKLLHQIASGIAHEMRNGITGARMAIELHQQKCNLTEDESTQVAITQLEAVESYVQRLVSSAAPPSEREQTAEVSVCLQDVKSSLSAMAEHRNVSVSWNFELPTPDMRIADGASFTAAISNLVINALQVATEVKVQATATDSQIEVRVLDNGPGIEDSICDHIFDPFVTSKPEGLGLGLPLAQRVADRHGGEVGWKRCGDQTEFYFRAECIQEAAE